jgi:hypothetical protein
MHLKPEVLRRLLNPPSHLQLRQDEISGRRLRKDGSHRLAQAKQGEGFVDKDIDVIHGAMSRTAHEHHRHVGIQFFDLLRQLMSEQVRHVWSVTTTSISSSLARNTFRPSLPSFAVMTR